MHSTQLPPLSIQVHLLDVLDAVEVGNHSGDPAGDLVGIEIIAWMGEEVPDFVFLVTTA